MLKRISIIAIGFLLTAPVAGQGADPFMLVGGPGNQTAPSLWGSRVAYLDDSLGPPDVYVTELATSAVTRVTSDGRAHGAPAINSGFLASRVDGAVELYLASSLAQYKSIAAPGSGRTVLSSELVAWEQDASGGGDVGWYRVASAAPVVLSLPGTQRAVAAYFDWVAYIDDSGAGAVHVVDTRDGSDRVVFNGAAGTAGMLLDVSVWAANSLTAPLVAVSMGGVAATEIAVVDADGVEQQRLAIPGMKLNPHLRGDWVGFEDLSTGVSQVVLWNRLTSRLFVPAPTGSLQILHDLMVTATSLSVVWADKASTDFDVYALEVTLPLPDPPPPVIQPATCSDATAIVLADITVIPDGRLRLHDRERTGRCDHADRRHDEERDDGYHEANVHDDIGGGVTAESALRRGAGGAYFRADAATPVLVCIDVDRIVSGWVGIGSRVVASPAELKSGVATLEARLVVQPGEGRAGAVVSGRPGGSLRVRVLSDPGGSGNGPSDGATCGARWDCPPPSAGLARHGHFGCGSAGSAGSYTAILLVGLGFLVGAGPLRRRPRR